VILKPENGKKRACPTTGFRIKHKEHVSQFLNVRDLVDCQTRYLCVNVVIKHATLVLIVF